MKDLQGLVLVAALFNAMLVGHALGQSADPEVEGQLFGPYQLKDYINDPNDVTCPDEWAEIAHIATLGPPNDGYVLLWCQRDIESGGGVYGCREQETWLWDKTNPNDLETVIIDNAPDGSEDTFCGAHTFLSGQAGELVSMGGTNMVEFADDNGAVGTKRVYKFDNAQVGVGSGPTWNALDDLSDFRYYNSALRESEGEIVTFGNTGNLPVSEPPGPSTADERREEYKNATWTSLNNVPRVGAPCVTLAYYPMATANYPDVRLLKSGNWLRVDTPPSSPTHFFDKQSCPGQPTPERFIGSIAGGPVPTFYGSSVHILYFDEFGDRAEVVYAIGGNSQYVCGNPTGFSSTVMKMVNPQLDMTQWDGSVPDLFSPRATHNVILLLDGSMLVIGGANHDGSGGCQPVYNMELYKPPEVFAVPSSGWLPMAPITHPRTYHSVAALLRDGSVVIAGGTGQNLGSGSSWEPAWHSLERYQPPYFYQATRRPKIVSVVGPDPLTYGSTFDINVSHVSNSDGEFRVALLAPCTGTHNLDFNQRYVQLKVTLFTPPAGGNPTQIKVDAPENGKVAPPGWYLLTVVNDVGIPSPAKWVRVDAP